jgi:hypothetical protein
MALLKRLEYFYFIIIIMSIISCNTPRRIYIANKTDKAITLNVDINFDAGKGTILSEFKESLDGKRIEPGSTIINFGMGKWNAGEEESLKRLLQNISVKKDGSTNSFLLPKTLKVGHGTFIPELIVKIEEPK